MMLMGNKDMEAVIGRALGGSGFEVKEPERKGKVDSLRKEKELDGDREAKVEDDDEDEKCFCPLVWGR